MKSDRPWALLTLGLLACHHRTPSHTELGPEQACADQLVLEFTNHRTEEVEVGWIPAEELRATPDRAPPLWLGVVGRGSARYEVPGPGRVIFRTANPAALPEDRHQVTYRLLCDRPGSDDRSSARAAGASSGTMRTHRSHGTPGHS